jgi:hypothetical protein
MLSDEKRQNNWHRGKPVLMSTLKRKFLKILLSAFSLEEKQLRESA